MPFYGRPSKNCESCRERRIKCDRLQPVCSQCKRAGKSCGGYRDVPALLFRDETDKAAHRSATAKSRAGERRKHGATDISRNKPSPNNQPPLSWPTPPGSDDGVWGLVAQNNEPHVLVPEIPTVVSTPVDEQGLEFFFNQFANRFVGPHSLSPKGIASLPPLLQTVFDELPLRDAVVAVGLAALANIKRDRVLRLAAQEKYVIAIKYVRQAVANPTYADPDHTVKLIVMLTLYEMTCCNSGVDAWTMHIDGASALMKSVAFSKAFRFSQSRPSLQFFYISIVKYFLDEGPPTPELLAYTTKSIPSPSPEDLPAIRLVDILVRFIKLHLSLRNDLNCDPETAMHLIQAFDSELEDWERDLPDNWAFVLQDTTDLKNSYMGKRMDYNLSWAAADINHYFWTRLKANELILQYGSRMESPSPWSERQQRRAFETANRMITMSCAGLSTQMYSWVDGNAVQQREQPNWSPPLKGVFMLLFPMGVVGSSAFASEETHQWIVSKLEYIGLSMGIRRALELIPKVKRIRAWKQGNMNSARNSPVAFPPISGI